jgi:hypothetical protein
VVVYVRLFSKSEPIQPTASLLTYRLPTTTYRLPPAICYLPLTDCLPTATAIFCHFEPSSHRATELSSHRATEPPHTATRLAADLADMQRRQQQVGEIEARDEEGQRGLGFWINPSRLVNPYGLLQSMR